VENDSLGNTQTLPALVKSTTETNDSIGSNNSSDSNNNNSGNNNNTNITTTNNTNKRIKSSSQQQQQQQPPVSLNTSLEPNTFLKYLIQVESRDTSNNTNKSANEYNCDDSEYTTQSQTFEIMYEGHTLGNLLKTQILQDPHVLVCNYKLPHPIEDRVVLHIKTDGTESPDNILKKYCSMWHTKFDLLAQQMRESIGAYRDRSRILKCESKSSKDTLVTNPTL
jgi:DNA-directed RNA polymerase subunit L